MNDPADRDDEEQERLNRQLLELLNELRVALPGVQVLFAFLLVLPFQQGFAEISDADRGVYVAALIASAFSNSSSTIENALGVRLCMLIVPIC